MQPGKQSCGFRYTRLGLAYALLRSMTTRAVGTVQCLADNLAIIKYIVGAIARDGLPTSSFATAEAEALQTVVVAHDAISCASSASVHDA